MDAGQSPLLIGKNQVSFALNVTNRGGFLHPRNPLQVKTLNFNGDFTLQTLVLSGNFQGRGYYRPDSGTESLIAQIAGHLIKFTEGGNGWLVSDISIVGDLNSATTSQVWMWQSEKWLIVQDGTGTLPIFYDGITSRRSYGPSMLLGTTAADFTPPAIGQPVTLMLLAPYTGPYDIPVILNGEFYQPTHVAGGYQVRLTNLLDTPENDVPVNTAVVIQPGTVGVIVGGIGLGDCGGGNISFETILSSTTGLTTGHFSIPGDGTGAPLGKLVTLTGWRKNGGPRTNRQMYVIFCDPVTKNVIFQDATFDFGCFQVDLNTTVIDQNNTSPNVIIGYTTIDFPAPAVGASINTVLTQPYTGDDGQVVYVQNNAYTIAKPPPPGPSTTLIVINLTDGSVVPAVHPKTIMSVPELPAGRNGAYGMGCNCCVLTDGISYIIGDVVGSGAGTQANNYRDAVLKVTQNDFLFGGGSFRLPGTGDVATAVIFPPNLDTSLGQGPLQIGTAFSFFTNVVPGTDPATWPGLTTPIQTESLKDNGALGQNSTISVNSDTFFRSNIGIGSLVLARRAFQGFGNKPISNEVGILLNPDDQALLQYSSAISFNNRFQCTNFPVISPNGVAHRGMVSLNFELISTIRDSSPPAWEGLQTGLNIFQAITGRVNGSLRAFAFTCNYNTNALELYEFLGDNTTLTADNGVTPIVWAFETANLFNRDVKSLNELVQLRDGEIYISDIVGSVHFDVYYRPDFYECWTKWNQFDVCESSDASNSKPGYRMRVGLGQPSPNPCEAGNNRPLRNGYFFQFRIVVTGQCVFKGMRVKAITIPQPEFAPIICDTESCQTIDCDAPDNYALYSLQGIPPAATLPDSGPVPRVSNQAVYYPYACTTSVISITGYPVFLTYDTVGQQFVVAANTFYGTSQELADAAALQAVTDFVTTNTANGNLYCEGGGAATCNNADTRRYGIQGYFDGFILNTFGSGNDGKPTWDGQFITKCSNLPCLWEYDPSATDNLFAITGKLVDQAIVTLVGANWEIRIYYYNAGSSPLWFGKKAVGSTPDGVYAKYAGAAAGPATITIIPLAGTAILKVC